MATAENAHAMPREESRVARRAVARATLIRSGQVFPIEIVRDDLRLLANHPLGASIAPLGKQPAEFVHHFVRVEPDPQRVVTNVAPRKDALGPARQVVLFERLPELDAEFCFCGQLFEGDAPPFARCPEDWSERFLFESHIS